MSNDGDDRDESEIKQQATDEKARVADTPDKDPRESDNSGNKEGNHS